MKKNIGKKILLVLIVFVFVIWGASLLRCEILTWMHGQEFRELYKETTMVDDIEYFKVLEYSDTSARVYYVDLNYSGGITVLFLKENNGWVLSEWTAVWSDMGSASGVIWPYWWHFIYGGF